MSNVSYEVNVGWDFTFGANSDLSSSQFYFVTQGSDGYLDIAGAGALALGVIQDGPVGTATSIRACSVRCGGITKVACGGTFVAGDKVTSDASGKCVKYTGATVYTGTPYTVSGSQVLGLALAAGASGSDSTILLRPSGLSA